jgi:hypothetical protein
LPISWHVGSWDVIAFTIPVENHCGDSGELLKVWMLGSAVQMKHVTAGAGGECRSVHGRNIFSVRDEKYLLAMAICLLLIRDWYAFLVID